MSRLPRTAALALMLAAVGTSRADEQQAGPPGTTPPQQGYPPPQQGYPPPPPQGYPPQSYPPPAQVPQGYPPVYTPYQNVPPIYRAPVSGPDVITDFDETAPIPYGYVRETRRRKGLIIGGSVTLGATYLFTLLVAAGGAATNDIEVSLGEAPTDYSALLIPVLGPFIQLSRSDSDGAKFGYAQLAIGQSAGAILLLIGLANPRHVLVRNDMVSITPMVDRTTSGMMVSGRF